MQHSHAVVAHMQNAEGAEILRRRYSPRQVLDLMGRFDFAVGMRLYFPIFAVLRGTPIAALQSARAPPGSRNARATPESVDIGQLIAIIDRAWDTRDTIRATMGAHRPVLQERAQQTKGIWCGSCRSDAPSAWQHFCRAPNGRAPIRRCARHRDATAKR